MAFIWLAPIVWLVLQSFTGEYGLASQPKLFPEVWSFENYIYLATNMVKKASGSGYIIEDSAFNFFWSTANMEGKFVFGGFMQTLLISVFSAVISTLFTLATAYAFSRLRFKARKPMMRLILILGMFPGFVSLIILYNTFKILGIGNSIWTLVICYSGGAGMGYYIAKGFFDTISKQIDEAAMIDGATKFQIFYKITLPLSKPIIVYTVMTSFMAPWAEYITASYMLTGGAQNNKTGTVTTVSVMLYEMVNATEKSLPALYWGQFCAGAVLIAVPISLLFILMQKNYVSGVTGGAVKG
ncbi:MAG: ABC transporter permease subunit [Candidatus Enteromonas sp.]|nr:ABC transporter permease subunit [bacterium]MDD6917644.1 ABC transporter permease subunit [bacterium]MDY6100328.1 ABC transporter permease subunit [Candidatus Enteromonas sp.]